MWQAATLGILILAGGTTVNYVINYLTTYATATLHMAKTVGFAATVTTGLTGVIFAPIGGMLADRVGRKPMMMGPWFALLILTIPAFWLLSTTRSTMALLGMAMLMATANMLNAPSILTAISERLPVRARASALGLIYAVAISVFGGSTQFTIAWLTGVSHSALAPAWYMTGAVAVSLIAMALQPETALRQVVKDEAKLPAEARAQLAV
jgi:MFS family permease